MGGYQLTQKWLKDRRDSKPSFEDIPHYQKITVAFTETDKFMKEINQVIPVFWEKVVPIASGELIFS